MNVPYGEQSAAAQRQTVRGTQNLYRRLGRFIETYRRQENEPTPVVDNMASKADRLSIGERSDAGDSVTVRRHDGEVQELRNLDHVYVLAKSTHYGHELSFQKFSNQNWASALHFANGGLSVNLLRLDPSKKSKARSTLQAYQELGQSKAP